MPLGWIDFSKSERNKVLSVLDLLTEAGTLDELGISPIRDGYANLFFPGTSTIQTRAKYFLMVPYTLKDLEYSSETNPNRMLRELDNIERWCCQTLLDDGSDTEGLIGSRTLQQNRWVKRTPASIYWAGLRNYGIFKGGNLSLTEYVRAICAMKGQKATLAKLGNRNDNNEDRDADDKDAGDLFRMQFWNIPTYSQDWKNDLSLNLTAEEGAFLKKQIIKSHPDSFLAFILENRMTEVFNCESFRDLRSLMPSVPGMIREDYALACSFSEFLYVLRTIYNVVVSEEKNEDAEREWHRQSERLAELSSVDLESIFTRLKIQSNVFLCRFLRKEQELMRDGDLEGMKTEIKRRERELKQSRAKTMHPGEVDPSAWFGGKHLDYRFGNVKIILKDIFESEGCHVKSK